MILGNQDNVEYDPLDEPGLPQRDAQGRFLPGSSGNRKGRSYHIPRDPKLPASRRRVISSVADEEIEVKVGGKRTRMTLYEANVRSLGHSGVRDRVAAQRFIDLVTGTSERDLQHRLRSRMFLEEINRIAEENERLKEKLEPTSGVVTLEPAAWAEFEKSRYLDDEESVAEIMGKSPPQ